MNNIYFRSDIEKSAKDVKSLSTELKYIDSNIKKDATSGKTEISTLSKGLKGLEKDLTTLHNMVEVLNQEQGSSVGSDELSAIKADMKKVSSDIKACDKRIEDSEKRQLTAEKEATKKMETLQDVISKKIAAESDLKSSKMKDDLLERISTCTKQMKELESKLAGAATAKSGPDTKEVESRIKKSADDLTQAIETSVRKCKEELNTKLVLADTKTQKVKDDLTQANKETLVKLQAVEKDCKLLPELQSHCSQLEGSLGKLQTSSNKVEESINKLNTQIGSLESKQAGTKPDTSGDLKKEVDKINMELKTTLGKLGNQETLVDKIKQSLEEVSTKIGKLEKSVTSSKPDDSKKELDAINNLVKENQKKAEENKKKMEEKLNNQEKGMKEITEKIGKLEKVEPGKPSLGSDTSKLSSLTKAIDTIQENSKSLETMVKKMKTEFPTLKDMEKLKTELLSKVSGKGGLDPNHADIGPIMDSLIMTNDRPYVDCTTLTPMTGTGLIKFERFNAMNKLPWDDVNDQFIIQEPGVYAVFLSAILQDATLSVKIASNMLEREICSVGSRDGLLGTNTPAFVFRSGLFQIEDDDNVCETVLIEIHADNDDSFIDKNVCLTLYKIAESTGGD